MLEHRLIERMVGLLAKELERSRSLKDPDVELILKGVDFFRTYADRTHHGKEEDILFRDLKEKELPPDLKSKMDRLFEEHRIAREHVKGLERAALTFRSGRKDELDRIIGHLSFLVGFYPKHIELEDKDFFFPVQELFTKEENDRMLLEFWEFDRKMVHEKYERIVNDLELKK